MALPLIPVLIVAGLLGAAGAAVALWPEAKGKRVLLLGATASGKSTLAEFLTSGTIPARYIRTGTTKTKVPTDGIKLGDLHLKVDKIWDAPGDREAWRAWHDKAKQADLILYLINFAKADSPKYCDQVRRDTGQIALWLRDGELPRGARPLLVITHLDTVPGYARLQESELDELARQTAPVGVAVRQLGSPLVAGSLRSVDQAARLTYRIFDTAGWTERE